MTTYSQASNEVLTIANQLINQYHEHLATANIGFIFRDKATTSKGKTVYATTKKPPSWLSVYKELHFLIEIAQDEWTKLMTDQRIALIDHELCHCGFDPDDEDKTWIIGHDVEEFREIIGRHGFWNASLLKSSKTFKDVLQTKLDGFEAKIDNGEVIAVDPEIMQEGENAPKN